MPASPPTSRLSRRRFLALGAGAASGLLAASLPLVGCTPRDYPAAGSKAFTDAQFAVLSAACATVLPPVATAASVEAADLPRRMERLLAAGNRETLFKLRQLFDLLEELPWLSLELAGFTRQSPAVRARTLARWEHSPLAMQRQGFQGLKQLVASIFYMHPASWAAIDYPGPWIGRIDVGTGLDNRRALPNPNPNVLRRYEG